VTDYYISPSGRKYVPQPSSPPETVLLVGTGAIAHSWLPVSRALKKIYPHVPDGEENLAFASVVYDLRHRAYIAQRWRFGLYGMSRRLKQQLGTMWDYYERLVSTIAEELRSASDKKEISARPFVRDLRERVATGGDYAVITTNWDFCLEDVFDDVHVTHIHGDIDTKGSLYLPAEMGWEPYRELRTRRIYVGTKFKPWHFWKMRITRYPDLWGTLSGANWLVTRVRRLIVVGLSFSPLDAELGNLVASIVNPSSSIQELVIIDLDPEPILRRVSFHAHGRIDNLRLLAPDEVGSL
jgi:hypothetical protein